MKLSIKVCAALIAIFTILTTFTALPAMATEQTSLYYAEPMFTAIVSTPINGKDPIIIQDGDLSNEYNTYQGDSKLPGMEWYGYTFDKTYTVHQVEFTEGSHFWNGGFFLYKEIKVEALINGSWTEVSATISPEYKEFDPIYDWQHDTAFETYTLTLVEDTACDGVRVTGQAGGQGNFTTCAEVRVQAYLTADEIEEVKQAAEMLKDAEKAQLLKYYKNKSGVYKSGMAISSPNDGWTRLEMEDTDVATIVGGSVQESGFFSGGKAAAGFDYNNTGLRAEDCPIGMDNISHVTLKYTSANAGDTVAKLVYNSGDIGSGILVQVNDDPAFMVETIFSNDASSVCWISIPMTLVAGENTINISSAVQNANGDQTWMNYDFLDVKDPAVIDNSDTGSYFALSLTGVVAISVIAVTVVRTKKRDN